MSKVTIFHPLECNTPGDPYIVNSASDAEYYLAKGFLLKKPSDEEIAAVSMRRAQEEWEKAVKEQDDWITSLKSEPEPTPEEVPEPAPVNKSQAPKKTVVSKATPVKVSK